MTVEFEEIGCHSNCDVFQTVDKGLGRSGMDGLLLCHNVATEVEAIPIDAFPTSTEGKASMFPGPDEG